ncbi:MAG TPA: GNAT family N-acetyltransferase [Streptosporangiaceae bacterium]|nr:GNAT family N-acetyltransferase [Streptosporangiaceae bacterium]
MTSPVDPYPIRPIAEDEFGAFHLVDEHAFHGSPTPAAELEGTLSLFEWSRSLAAFDGADPVGITGIYSFQLSVPGALLPAAGVSWVGVLPTYRRRGILRSLMRRQLADIQAAGEPLAVLWASEAAIYGRYGYGQATSQLAFTIHRGEGALLSSAGGGAAGGGSTAGGGAAGGGLRLRLVTPSDAWAELAKVYDIVLQSRPGFFARSEPFWRRVLADPENRRNGASPLRCVIAEDDSGPRGYALYTGTGRWGSETMLEEGRLDVRELVAADPAASALLWADLLSRDLTSEFHAGLRPVDDPLLYQLADPRRTRAHLSDGLWVRLIDLPKALAGRRYACPVDVVIEVRDTGLPVNEGRWRLRTADGRTADGLAADGLASDGLATDELAVDGLAASCERSTDPADLVLDVASLGAAYLGGTRLGALAEAGLVTDVRPGAVRRMSAAMAWDPAPWCPKIF